MRTFTAAPHLPVAFDQMLQTDHWALNQSPFLLFLWKRLILGRLRPLGCRVDPNRLKRQSGFWRKIPVFLLPRRGNVLLVTQGTRDDTV